MFARIAASPSKTLLALLCAYMGATFAHSWDEKVWLTMSAWQALFILLLLGTVLSRRGKPDGPRERTQRALNQGNYSASATLAFPETIRSSPSRGAAPFRRIWQASVLRLIFLVAMVIVSACWRFESALPDPTPLPPGVEYRGVIVREPVRRAAKFRLTLGNVTAGGRSLGAMTVSVRNAFEVREGDTVAWRCLVFADNDQPGFCAADGSVKVVGHGFHPLLAMRAKLRATVRAFLPEPEASLLLGLLVGDRGGLPEALILDFRATGTSHVLAVSGYNVVLVADAMVILFALAGLARRHAALVVVLCIVGFAGLAGADPPVTRAALMGSAGLIAAALGRRYHAPNGLLLAAVLMLIWNPLVLRNDIGFRLSFAAVVGLSAFGRAFGERMTFIPIDGVRSALGETLGATFATIPIMLHDFGSLAFSSPMTNVMIAPLVPFATAVGAVAVTLSMVFAPLGLVPATATGAALRLMRSIVSWWAAALPATPLQIGTAAAFALYVPIGLLWLLLRKKEKI